ncbi:branched-chain amino acid ABC transporter permease [Haloactinomyces albus]|uniref:Branched-chain amino acid transport system permease protein n=1 Tax=Haloactinomyces albus TaxID=1352928 RepID=A0AAE3ZI02_9ACTN|nr:branched-chain amino acid ABC transporter permease [Haloactinomyces albus]MDR7303953.1 branched-chain amino acid transport system permease protein [Haloactinomyces albus]
MIEWYDAHLVLIQSTFVNLLLVLSIQVPLRMGVFSFAGVGSYGLGAYVSAILTIRYEIPAYVAIGVGILLAASIGYLLALVVSRLKGLYLAMATIAFVLILSVIATNGGELTGGAQGLYGAISDLNTLEVIMVSVVVIVLLALSERGATKRRIDAVREDPELAMSVGIPVVRLQRLSFVISGALGACAGGMNALLRTTVSPQALSFHLVVLALTMIIVGGLRSWIGALIGAVVFTWLPSMLQLAGEWQSVVYGLIVVLAAIFVPTGLLGLVQDTYRKLRRRSSRVVARDSVSGTDDTDTERALFASLGGDNRTGGSR